MDNQIAAAAVEKLNPRTDGERVTMFNIIQTAIVQAIALHDHELICTAARRTNESRAAARLEALQKLECIIGIDGNPKLQAKCHKVFAPILHESRAAHASEPCHFCEGLGCKHCDEGYAG